MDGNRGLHESNSDLPGKVEESVSPKRKVPRLEKENSDVSRAERVKKVSRRISSSTVSSSIDAVQDAVVDLTINNDDVIPPTPPPRRTYRQINIEEYLNATVRHRQSVDGAEATQPIDQTLVEASFVTVKEEVTHDIAGRISKMQLKNFMCHGNLTIDFKLEQHNMCFITGRNGSGKSAVLAAMNLGLGGRGGVFLERGRTVREYIKTGCNDATIRITLTNSGSGEYQPDIFGNQITVVRKFTKGGGGSYQMLDNRGHEVGRKYNKLEAVRKMCDTMNIQIDNRFGWMTQDRCRTFLAETKDKKLYEFFMNASQLQEMRDGYAEVEKKHNDNRDWIDTNEQFVESLKNRVATAKRKMVWVERMEQMEADMVHLEKEKHWSGLIEIEEQLEENREFQHKCHAKMQEYQEEIETLKREMNECEGENSNVVEQAKDVASRYGDVTLKVKKARDKCARIQHRIDSKQADIRECQEEIRRNEKEYEKLRRAIEQLEVKEPGDVQADQVALEEELSKMKAQQQLEANKASVAQTDMRNFKSKVSDMKDSCVYKKKAVDRLSGELRSKKTEISELEGNQDNRLARFGRETMTLANLIERNRTRFQQMPKGPLGSLISVADSKWIAAVEKCLGNMLKSYAVDNFNDSKLLQSLMSQAGMRDRPTIIISKFQHNKYDVSRNEPHCYPTVLSQIRVDNDNAVVFNTLVDQTTIERIILIESDEVARDFMKSEPPPQNVRQCFTKVGSQIYPTQPQYRYYDNSNFRPRFLIPSVSEYIRQLKQEIMDCEQELKKANEAWKEENSYLKEFEKNCTECEQRFNVSNKREKALRIRCNRMNEELKDFLMQNTDKVSQLRQEQLDNESSISTSRDQLKDAEAEKENFERELELVDDERKEAENEQENVKEQMKPIEERLEELQTSKMESDGKMNVRKQFISKTQNKLTEVIEEERELQEKERQKQTEIQRELGADAQRPKTVRAEAQLMRSVTRLQSRLDACKQDLDGGDPQKMRTEYEKLNEEFQKLQEALIETTELADGMGDALEMREKGYHSISRNVGLRMRSEFVNKMKDRNFDAQLVINHNRKTMRVMVRTQKEIDTHGEEVERRDLRGLSGGERSYTTTCLMMAFWEAMDCPFRCVDEFDVFMDMVNRRIAIDHLVEMATNDYPSQQFIYFTPQTMQDLIDKPVNVVELKKSDEQ